MDSVTQGVVVDALAHGAAEELPDHAKSRESSWRGFLRLSFRILLGVNIRVIRTTILRLEYRMKVRLVNQRWLNVMKLPTDARMLGLRRLACITTKEEQLRLEFLLAIGQSVE